MGCISRRMGVMPMLLRIWIVALCVAMLAADSLRRTHFTRTLLTAIARPFRLLVAPKRAQVPLHES